MKKTKLFQVLTALSAWELRNLKQFVTSPFFNQRKDVVKLLEFFIENQNGENAGLNREAAFEFVHPNKIFDDQSFRLLISRLLKLTEDFLACREALGDETQWKINLSKAYRKMNMEKPFKKTIGQIREQLEKSTLRNAEYCHKLYRAEYEYYAYISSRVRSGETNLQLLTDTFDTFYIAGKLQQACMMISHQAVFKKQYEFGLLEAVLGFIEQNEEVLSAPAVAVYYNCYKAVTSPDSESHFQKLRELIQTHQNKFTESELSSIYLMTINYCIRKLNTGKRYYIREGFELYCSGLASEILLENDVISQFTFNNTIAMGLYLKEYEWIEHFIKEYKNKLNRTHRRNVVNFNLAKLRYEQRKFKEAMRLLVQFDSEDYLLTLGAKTLLLKMYYESEEFEVLDSLLESIRIYLQRKQVLGYHKKHFENIIRFTKKMMDLPPFDKTKKEQLRQEILNTKIQSERDWFLKQLE